MSIQYNILGRYGNFDFVRAIAIMKIMNPYEAPQSSLNPEPEVRPRVPVAYQSYDSFLMLKILFVIFLVLVEVTLGILLLECLAFVVGFDDGSENGVFAQILPYVSVGFLGVGWILWKLKQASDRKNS